MNYIEAIKQELMKDGISDEYANVYTLLVLVKGTDTTMEDVHDAWAILANPKHPDHKSLIPFDELSYEIQELDRKYMESIHRVANLIGV